MATSDVTGPVGPEDGSDAPSEHPTVVEPDGDLTTAEAAAAATPGARRLRRDDRRRKIIILALLLALLAALAYVAWYVSVNKRLPIPTTESGRDVMEAPQYLFSITGQGRQSLNRPTGVVVGPNDRVYVTDIVARSIKVFTRDGAYLFEFRDLKDGKINRLNAPVHLALDSKGNVWVTDRLLRGVYVFDPEGKFIRTFLSSQETTTDFAPLAITLDAADNVYITDVGDAKNHQVRVFDPAGTQTAAWGETEQVAAGEDSPGSFYFPNGIAVRSTGTKAREVFVADGDNRRLQMFSPKGVFDRLTVTEGVPRGITLDSKTPEGLVLLVADAIAHQVDIYSLKGEHLTQFGSAGVFDGQFQFPNDVAVDTGGRIYITDRGNNRVQVWGFPQGDITGVTKLPPGVPTWVCCLPLPLLLLPLFFRKRRFVVTDDFVDGMIVAESIKHMDDRRFRWIIPEAQFPQYEKQVVEGVELAELLHDEAYSYTDAADLAERLQIAIEEAGVLSMARRHKRLCTEDEDLARLAIALDIEVYDREAWLAKYKRASRDDSPPDSPPDDSSPDNDLSAAG